MSGFHKDYDEMDASNKTKTWLNEHMDTWEETIDELKDILNNREMSYQDAIESMREKLDALLDDFKAVEEEFEERAVLL